jgi:alpha-L-rhamnosidase
MRGYLQDGLLTKDNYADWCVPPESPSLIHSQDPARKTSGTLISTAYYFHLLNVMARYARLLDKPTDAKDFEAQAQAVKSTFETRFYKHGQALYDNGTQTSSILALTFKLAPEEDRKAILDRLAVKIVKESDNHVGVGLVGAQWLMRTLADNGLSDVAYSIATQKTYPGWGYMVEQGATTVWELWNGNTADPAMNSGNHVMQIGDLGVWMYEYLAGIRPDPEQPGFKHIIIRPYLTGDLSFVRASHRSMYGTIASRWERNGNQLRLDVTIPANTTATVYVPSKDVTAVTESGRPATSSAGLRFLRMEGSSAVFEAGSGTYAFASGL